jgi:large subunit ribosomal protein L32e
METIKKLLDVRKKNKKSKPDFVIKESKFSSGVKTKWRYPRGMHNGSRQYHKGKPIKPTTGYGSPKAVRHLHSSGKSVVLVKNTTDLEGLNKDTQIITIAKIGKKKMLAILDVAKTNNIEVTNVKDINQKVEKISTDFAARKKLRENKQKNKTQKEAEKTKRAEEKKKKEEEKKAKESKEKSTNSEEKEQEIKEQKKSIEKEIIKKK